MERIGDKFWLVNAQSINGEIIYDKEATEFKVTELCMKSVMAKNQKTGGIIRTSIGYRSKELAERFMK